MNILVYGAGVIGSVYAARLKEAGYNVSLLARGQRAISLRTQGILLENVSTGQHTTTHVPIVEHLAPTDDYDVVIVTVRLDHLESILPILAANRQIPTVLFMVNNPAGMQSLEILEPQRVILGFPSVGGVREGEITRHVFTRLVPTTMGKDNGHVTPRLQQLVTAFKKAGFSVALDSDMQTWLKTHAIMASSMIAAVAMAGGKSAQLSKTRKHVVMMVQAIREGLLALQACGVPITPFSMKILFLWMPWLAVILLQGLLRTPYATLGIDPHLIDAIDEARLIARDIKTQLQQSPVPTPILNHLISYLETPA